MVFCLPMGGRCEGVRVFWLWPLVTGVHVWARATSTARLCYDNCGLLPFANQTKGVCFSRNRQSAMAVATIRCDIVTAWCWPHEMSHTPRQIMDEGQRLEIENTIIDHIIDSGPGNASGSVKGIKLLVSGFFSMTSFLSDM